MPERHFVSRSLRKLGFKPRIIPAIYVKPFIKGQKNDYNDAEAIAEAALRPNLPTVSEKARTSSICKLSIVSGLAWCPAELQQSIRSAPS